MSTTLADTYFLAASARNKLNREASRGDHNLRLLVSHANLLDNLMDSIETLREQKRIQRQESLRQQISQTKVTFDLPGKDSAASQESYVYGNLSAGEGDVVSTVQYAVSDSEESDSDLDYEGYEDEEDFDDIDGEIIEYPEAHYTLVGSANPQSTNDDYDSTFDEVTTMHKSYKKMPAVDDTEDSAPSLSYSSSSEEEEEEDFASPNDDDSNDDYDEDDYESDHIEEVTSTMTAPNRYKSAMTAWPTLVLSSA